MNAILLAAYNGEDWLDKQLESLFSQTDQNFQILVRDDGSTDSTMEILKHWQTKHPDQIRIYENDTPVHGACANFFALARLAAAMDFDYFFFCDQDDVWLPDKIERSMRAVRTVSGPVLLHTDLKTIDKDGQILCPSFIQQENIQTSSSLPSLILQNNATGCTMCFDRKLLELALMARHPETIKMHDWWFALAASCFGTTVFLDEALVLYRQHGTNSIGANSQLDKKAWKEKIRKNFVPLQERDFFRTMQQFCQTYQPLFKEKDRQLLSGWLSLPEKPKPIRMAFMVKNKIKAQNPAATIFKWLTL